MTLSLANFSATGTIHMQARIAAGVYQRGNGQENLWASDEWTADGTAGQVGTIEEGTMSFTLFPGTLSATTITFRRLCRWDRDAAGNTNRDALIFNISGGNLDQQLDNSSDPYRITIVTESGGSIRVIQLNPARSGGGSWGVRWEWAHSSLNSEDFAAIFGVAAGQDIIFAFHEGTAAYADPDALELSDFVTSDKTVLLGPALLTSQSGGTTPYNKTMYQTTAHGTAYGSLDAGDLQFEAGGNNGLINRIAYRDVSDAANDEFIIDRVGAASLSAFVTANPMARLYIQSAQYGSVDWPLVPNDDVADAWMDWNLNTGSGVLGDEHQLPEAFFDILEDIRDNGVPFLFAIAVPTLRATKEYVGDTRIVREHVGDVQIVAEYVGSTRTY